jgi:hypothetical protein
MSTVACDQEVFKDGTSMGFFDMPKEEAEKYCREQTEKTGYKHDWHYVAGRVHVKALIPTEVTKLRRQLADTQAKLKLLHQANDSLRSKLESLSTCDGCEIMGLPVIQKLDICCGCRRGTPDKYLALTQEDKVDEG